MSGSNEVDFVFDTGKDKIVGVETKAGKTWTRDYLKNLNYWGRVVGRQLSEKIVVYGGEEEFTLDDTRFLPWHAAGKILDRFK